MELVCSDQVVGETLILKRAPEVRIYEDALFVPQSGPIDEDGQWGVYDCRGVLIEEAAYKRGPGRRLVGQSNRLERLPSSPKMIAEAVYAGSVHTHYGHHLLGVLPRFWLDIKRIYPSIQILIHSQITVEQWMSIPFVKDTVGTLHFKAEDFVAFDEVTRVAKLHVIEPSLVEQSHAFLEFAALTRRIGQALSPPRIKPRGDPVFISKEHLGSGVWKVVNEGELVSHLQESGVRIVYPEQLSLSDQIAVFNEHEHIAGLMGSGLHTALFAEQRRDLIALGYDASVPSNFLLIDGIRSQKSTYFHPKGNMIDLGRNDYFHSTWELMNPRATAQALLKVIRLKQAF